VNETRFDTEFYCTNCLAESPHTVIYVNDILYKVTCKTCGKESIIHPDLPKEIYIRYFDRILSKPKRITKEFRQDMSHFLSSLPYRLLSKSFRTYRELKEIYKYMHKHDKPEDK
jgi:transcription elongation factor Elf1